MPSLTTSPHTRSRQPLMHRLGFPLAIALLLSSLSSGCTFVENDKLTKVKSSGELVVVARRGAGAYVETPEGPVGFEYDLAKAFAQSLGVKLKFVVVERYGGILPELMQGGADLAAGVAAPEQAPDQFLFTPAYQQIRQQVVYREGTMPPLALKDLIGRQIEVPSDTPYTARLRELQKTQNDELKWEENEDKNTEELLQLVWEGLLEITVADSQTIALNRQFFPELQVAFDLAPPQSVMWAVPASDDRSLYDAAVKFLEKYKSAGEMARLVDRYYGPANHFSLVNLTVYHARVRNRLPLYKNAFETASRQVNLDWRLLAAMAYQESFWDPSAVSPTGVRGMMMLTEDTAKQVGVTNALDAAQSINGGARYLRDLYDRMHFIPLPDRTWFALAAYNLGVSHLEDARILTERQGGNQNKWSDVAARLPLLEDPKWYERTRYGFARGAEPVLFVNRVRAYYDVLVRFDEEERAKSRTEALKLKLPAL